MAHASEGGRVLGAAAPQAAKRGASDGLPRLWVRGLALVLACAAVVILGREVVATALSKHDAVARPAVVLAWNGNDGAALVSQAEHRLAVAPAIAPVDDVKQLAARALARSPLEVGAVRLLALTAERGGDADRAERLMTIAGRRSLRDGPTHAWLFDHWFRRQAWTKAFTHADILLRTHPQVAPAIDPSLVSAVSVMPEARHALALRLAPGPFWRARFLPDLAQSEADTGPLLSMLADLQRLGAKLSDDELSGVLMPLVGKHQFEEAYLIWTQSLPPKALATLANIYDPDFDGRPGPPPFNWKFNQPSGGAVEIAPAPGGGGERALSIHLYEPPTDVLASQLIVLPPGHYRLAGRALAEGDGSPGTAWSVRCDGGAATAQISPTGAAGRWTEASAVFEVPQEGCPAQWLELRSTPGATFQGSGIWWDKLVINRQDG
jgi:hypothetical protein